MAASGYHMRMPDAESVRRWLGGRIGYGALAASYWFLGMEESCDDPLAELDLRLQGDHIEDLLKAHQRLSPRFDRLFTVDPVVLQRTWDKLLIALLAAKGEPFEKEDRRAYQARFLGREAGETLLCDLLPLPSPATAQWSYSASPDHPELASRQAYQARWLPERIALFARLVWDHAPKFVVAYGLDHREHYKGVFGNGVAWSKFPIDVVPAWGEVGILHAKQGAVRVAIVPHPTAQGQKNATWAELGAWLGERS